MLATFARRAKAFREFWREARAAGCENGLGAWRQLAEYVQLKRQTGLSGHEYFLYELDRADKTMDQKREYVTGALHERFLAPLEGADLDSLLDDKFLFKQHFASLGLRVPAMYGRFHPVHGTTAAGDPLRTKQELTS